MLLCALRPTLKHVPILSPLGLRSAFNAMQWRRGLRAGLAVSTIMLVCHFAGWPMGWPALGAFQVIFVDNGGPYRSRLANIATIAVGGSLAVLLGVLAGEHLAGAIAITLLFCFAATLARVLSQPLAASSVTILTSYIIAFGGAGHDWATAVSDTRSFIAGGLWAAALSLVLWPVDPFRPARNAVAEVYATLAELVHALPEANHPEIRRAFTDLITRFRMGLETAHATLAQTPARMTSRTIRARNLSVLNESADLLLARLLRFAELGSSAEVVDWLASSLAPIEPALRHRPVDGAASFAPEGSRLVDLRRSTPLIETAVSDDPNLAPESRAQLLSALRDCALNFQVSYEAVRAIWTGAEPRGADASLFRPRSGVAVKGASPPQATYKNWMDTLRANLTLQSIMFRHALRLASVVTLDVILMYLLRNVFTHYTHGYWLAMTSIIVLQPYTGETVRKSSQRVAGTIAGGLLAALLASAIHSELGLLTVIGVGTTFCVAMYAVDYAWYCFFLTPTIVLLSLPHLRDWHFAEVRMGMTAVGALIAVAAMLLLWPERESLQLPGLLARGAAAEAGYLRAMLAFWRIAAGQTQRARIEAERTLLAPARRLCGLAAMDAEETLDHALVEHSIPLNPERASTEALNHAALTFTTYLRRLTQSITAVASIPDADPSLFGAQSHLVLGDVIEQYATRLDGVAKAVKQRAHLAPAAPLLLNNEQLRRLDRQVTILESTVEDIAAIKPA